MKALQYDLWEEAKCRSQNSLCIILRANLQASKIKVGSTTVTLIKTMVYHWGQTKHCRDKKVQQSALWFRMHSQKLNIDILSHKLHWMTDRYLLLRLF